MLKHVYIHLYNIFVSLLLKCGLDWSRRRYFISENKATCSLIATGLIFYDLRQKQNAQFPKQFLIASHWWYWSLVPYRTGFILGTWNIYLRTLLFLNIDQTPCVRSLNIDTQTDNAQ